MNTADQLPPDSTLGLRTRRSAAARRLAARAGRTPQAHAHPFEILERRVLLGGDHPSFSDFPTATPITIDGVTGEGSATGEISPAGDDDLFSFVAPATDFVTVLIDTENEASNTLDSHVQVYNSSATLLGSGANNDTLTSGFASDGFVGLVLTAGETYFIRVLGDGGTTGTYTVYVDAITTPATVNPTTGHVNVTGTISRAQDDIVYKIALPDTAAFDGITTANAQSDTFDARLDIYNSIGARIAADSLSGRLNDPYIAFAAQAGGTLYVRVRSDVFRAGATGGTGPHRLVMDAAAESIAMDPVTRLGSDAGSLATNFHTVLYTFQSQGSGLAFITAFGTGFAPIADPALHLYNSAGTQIAFVDDFAGATPQIQIRLTGGEQYWVVVDAFDGGGTDYALFIESNHTYDENQPWDDHESLIITDPDDENFAAAFARVANQATPIIWGTPYLPVDPGPPEVPITDHSYVVDGFGWGRIFDSGDTDLFVFTPPVDMLGNYQGEIDDSGMEPVWFEDHRPASRAQIILVPDFDSFANMFIRIFDSNFNLIYENDTISPPFPDPAGALDPSVFDPEPPVDEAFIIPELWGGEAYFIEVSATGTGRYAFQVTVDAFSEEFDDEIWPFTEPAEEGDFPGAIELSPAFGSGDARNFFPLITAGTQVRGEFTAGDPGDPAPTAISAFRVGELGQIEDIHDSDIYFFRASFTGMAEVRINTTALADDHYEIYLDVDDPFFPEVMFEAYKQKTYNSLLDTSLRIFDNDFVQVAYNDDNPAVFGPSDATTFGTLGGRTFHRRDAGVVFQVEQDNFYYIVVESGQKWVDGSSADRDSRVATPADLIDWRYAIGSYELLINAMPNLDFEDDHTNSTATLATPIRIEDDGTGLVTGIIDNTIRNPDDFDLFQFYAVGTGVATVTVSRTSGTVSPSVSIFDNALNLVTSANATAGVSVVTFVADVGSRFYILVDDPGSGEGDYSVQVASPPYIDDHADVADWPNVTDLTILDFLGATSITGSIEVPGDTDIFRFRADDFDLAVVTVTKTSPSLNPLVRVYEVGIDYVGTPVFLQVAVNDDISATNNNSSVAFPITPDRITGGVEYPYYYIVVSGSDPEAHSGGYTLGVALTPTDDHPDAGQFSFATPIVIDPPSGSGSSSGVLEFDFDDDLFTFTAPAGGLATVTIATADSDLIPTVRIFDALGTEIAANTTNTSGTALLSFFVVRDDVYFLLVDGNASLVDVGAYTVSMQTPTVDDHANETEFSLATLILLDESTGDGSGSGTIGTIGDTDLFTFETLDAGDVAVLITPATNNLIVRLRVYDAAQSLIHDVTAAAPGDTVSQSIVGAPAGAQFYLLVSLVFEFGASLTGDYAVALDGEGAPPPPDDDDDHPDTGEFGDLTESDRIALSALTGDGTGSGQIETAGDTDLFFFESLAPGRAFVQIRTPAGSLLDAAVRIFNSSLALVAEDSAGVFGANANVEFATGAPGETFYIEVDGLGAGVGTYTVVVDTAPLTHRLYFPEGFSHAGIREFVSIANPNDFTVSYRILLHYEVGEREAVVAVGSISPGARGGLTVSDGPNGVAPGVRTDEPYAIIIESDGPLGATLAHYDFGFSLGESFTSITSSSWTFARADKAPGSIFDFLVFYNPNDSAVVVTLSAYTSSGVVSVSRTVEAGRRGGWNFNDTPELPVGSFALVVTSAPVNPSDAHVGIVASLSHYDTANDAGYAALGDSTGGSTVGVITALTRGPLVESRVSFFNPGNLTANITIVGDYILTPLPDLVRSISVAPRSSVTFSGADLGFVENQPIGLRYSSSAAVSALFSETRQGDASGTTAPTQVGQEFFFGDAFINADAAGTLYLETLSFFNPGSTQIDVSIRLLFNDGTESTVTVAVDPGRFNLYNLHEDPTILARGGLNFFSLQITADGSFAAYMSHYDLFLNGGWGTFGAPLGPLTSLVG